MSTHPKTSAPDHHVSGTVSADRRSRAMRLLLGVLYIGALCLLILWEYHERLEEFSSDCEIRDQAKSALYNRAYAKFMAWTSPDVTSHVVTIAITADLEEIQNNLCLGRSYMADVLHALALYRPAVVVIDKFYSTSTCASEPASTEELSVSIQALGIPAIVGESTTPLETEVAGACLVRKPQLHFNASNVLHGLTRVPTESERLPLTWPVLSSAPEVKPSAHTNSRSHADLAPKPPQSELVDSLSLTAVKAYDPAFIARRGLQRLMRDGDHAYAGLHGDIPGISTTALLCAGGNDAVLRRWSLTCHGEAAPPDMLGRIVVIGTENASDEKLVLGQRRWGFLLQAQYIESLLSGSYLRSLPLLVTFSLFALFIFFIEGLPTLLLTRQHHWKKSLLVRHAYPKRRYVWVIFWAVTFVVLSAAASLALRFLPPLLLYGDIALIAITHLLLFLAEAAEHPLVHAYRHTRKATPMHSQHPHPNDPNDSAPEPTDGTVPAGNEPAGSKPAPPPAGSRTRPGSEGGTEG